MTDVNISLSAILRSNRGQDYQDDAIQSYFDAQHKILKGSDFSIDQIMEYLNTVPWGLVKPTLKRRSLDDSVDEVFMVVEDKIISLLVENIEDFKSIENFDPIFHAQKQKVRNCCIPVIHQMEVVWARQIRCC